VNEKPIGFFQGILGNPVNVAADLHWTRYMGLASRDPRWLANGAPISDDLAARLRQQFPRVSRTHLGERTVDGKPQATFNTRTFVEEGRTAAERQRRFDAVANEPTVYLGQPNDNEYGAMEAFANRLGREFNLTGPQLQAALWMGAADRTGLADSSRGTFMELMRRQIARRSQERGVSPSQVWDDFVHRRPGGTLIVPGLLAGGAAAAGAAAMTGADQDRAQ